VNPLEPRATVGLPAEERSRDRDVVIGNFEQLMKHPLTGRPFGGRDYGWLVSVSTRRICSALDRHVYTVCALASRRDFLDLDESTTWQFAMVFGHDSVRVCKPITDDEVGSPFPERPPGADAAG
jgi:hypothetical protein